MKELTVGAIEAALLKSARDLRRTADRLNRNGFAGSAGAVNSAAFDVETALLQHQRLYGLPERA